jgi:hypothetical protein
MYLKQPQEDTLNANREKIKNQEISVIEQYFALKKNHLGVGPALYRALEDILNNITQR